VKTLDPEALKIGYVILVAGRNRAIEAVQKRAGRAESFRWTHVAGCLGGYEAVEAALPRSRIVDIQKEYVARGYEIKAVRRRGQDVRQRYKTALWWATMNNLPYDTLQFFWFPLSLACSRAGSLLHRIFSSRKRFLCSELIAAGFYKEGDYFGKPADQVLPADFGDPVLFEEVPDIWAQEAA
jgi:hypothetical protein